MQHCIDIVHTCSRNPFAQSYLTVFIDGKQVLSVPLKFPTLAQVRILIPAKSLRDYDQIELIALC
jgi:hypothetical protein